jgi:hypothetical protein
MRTSVTRTKEAFPRAVRITDETLTVDLKDGRAISVPLDWYPRLLHGSPDERNNWQLIGDGEGIHWPDLDEDIGVAGLLEGIPSQESPGSLREWLQRRQSRRQSSAPPLG